jgi:hypothetical protein
MTDQAVERLVEVPAGWENSGDFHATFDGTKLEVGFGEGLDLATPPALNFSFNWVRSFRFLSEATYDEERDRLEVPGALLSELPLPDSNNPASDYYGNNRDIGKGPPRLFRLFHHKAGLIDVVASS